MAAHPRSGLETHEAVGLGRGGVDHLPDIDPHPVREHRQLVDQCDVDGAEDVFKELRQLTGLGRRDAHYLVADAAIELRRPFGALGRDTPDHLGRVPQRVVGASWVYALGRVGHIQPLADP